MPGASDVEARPDVSDADLVDSAVGGAEVGDRTTSLKELLRRRSTRVGPLLVALVADGSVPREIRTVAAVAMGREATAANEEALARAVRSEEPSVVAAAAESLARIGGHPAYDALVRANPTSRAGADRSVAAARTLISYRLGLGTARLSEPPAASLLEVDRERAVPLRFQEVGADEFLAARVRLEGEIPAISVTERASVRFSCGNEHLWLVLAEGVAGPDGSPVSGTDRVAGVVFKESECPDGWYVHEYVVTHPSADGVADVFGVRPSGRVVHFGKIDKRTGIAVVGLRAVDAPGVVALEFSAELSGPDGALVVREALVAPSRGGRRSPPSPRRGSG